MIPYCIMYRWFYWSSYSLTDRCTKPLTTCLQKYKNVLISHEKIFYDCVYDRYHKPSDLLSNAFFVHYVLSWSRLQWKFVECRGAVWRFNLCSRSPATLRTCLVQLFAKVWFSPVRLTSCKSSLFKTQCQ